MTSCLRRMKPVGRMAWAAAGRRERFSSVHFTLAEDSGADADERRAFLDGRFQVVTHAHGDFSELVFLSQSP